MQEREPLKIVKDDSGNIIALRNQYQGWSPVSTDEAIQYVKGELYKYFIQLPNIGKVNLSVEQSNHNYELSTDPTRTSRNLLSDIPTYSTFDE